MTKAIIYSSWKYLHFKVVFWKEDSLELQNRQNCCLQGSRQQGRGDNKALVGQWWPLCGVSLPSQHLPALGSMQEWQTWLSRTFTQDFVFDHKSSVVCRLWRSPGPVTACVVSLHPGLCSLHQAWKCLEERYNPLNIEMFLVFLGVCQPCLNMGAL